MRRPLIGVQNAKKRMHLWDIFTMCGPQVAKTKVAELGASIHREAAQLSEKSYVDDGSGGR